MRSRLRYSCISLIALLSLLLLGWGGSAKAAAPPSHAANSGAITVFAAASLTEAFTSIGNTFARANNVTVKFNFAGSDALVTQMIQGAPADVFASANQAQMTLATTRGLIA